MAGRPITGQRTIQGGTYDGTRLLVEFRFQDYRGAGVSLPHRYDIEARGGGLGAQIARLRVEVRDGLPRCTRLTVEAPNGVSSVSLRKVPVNLLMDEVLPLIAQDRQEVSPGQWRSEFLLPPDKAARAASAGHRQSKDERLRAFRDVWREVRAVSPGRVPSEVAKRLNLAPTTVYRLRDAAVAARLLREDEAWRESTRRKRADEADSATSKLRTTAKGQGK